MLRDRVEVYEYTGIGYEPLFACRDFRVAVLNYHPELLCENITNFQKHDLTDEAFILLRGRCMLFITEDETMQNIEPIELEPLKVFNVKAGTYHTHTLSEDAMVLIVEADDTCDDNSPCIYPDDAVRTRLKEMYES
ncbi:MAG: hypothetical protein K5662_07880 [Lachnospiraceae bacterium]|jgi:hypothetical protein|nr:hypothetical protein [Lachnospiraceae bacterium]